MAEHIVKISIRDMVSFVLRCGSIDSSYIGSTRAVEGTRIHQNVQRLRKKQALLNGETYEREYSLAYSFAYKGFVFHVDGRADGIWFKKNGVAVEEIKSTVRPLDFIENDPSHWHWAQAKCYAFLYGVLNGSPDMGILLTYVHVESNESKTFETHLTFAEAEVFFFDVIEKYLAFAKLDADRVTARNETGKRLGFPYKAYRKSQRAFAVAVYKIIAQEKKLFAQAPTGTGKTISTLFPAVKALSEGLADKIFYITAKTLTRQAAEEAFALMMAKGLLLRSVTITAKEKICFCEKTACNPVDCAFANGHFDRVNVAILDIIARETRITRTCIEVYARKHNVCPFEFSLDLTLFSDCMICDYNYVYDPKASLKRFFGEDIRGDYIVLHDEAHNLVDRARDMFSAQLEKSLFATMRKACRQKNRRVYNALGKLKNHFEDLGTETGVSITAKPPAYLPELLRNFAEKADRWMAEQPLDISEEFLEGYFLVKDFLRVSELFDERYVFYVETTRKEVVAKLLCLDPSYLLNTIQKKIKASVFFSATLAPMSYFRDVLGGDTADFTLSLPSPFESANLCLLVDSTISTMYKDRAASFEPIAERLYEMATAKKGNYLAFFSSYAYMRSVRDVFTVRYPHMHIVTQTQNMTEVEREAFLENFSKDNTDGLLGFTVLGGIFSEGIDLAGERLIGAAVVGVGLPLITPERNVMMDYYKTRGLDGFNYAYVFPGVNKVLQAAGRVIRSHADKGVVLLIDRRFASSGYKSLLPAEWAHAVRLNERDKMADMLYAFWNSGEPV